MQKFNYHSHTYRCKHADLDMEDEEYIKEYIKMGFKKVAITDHCPEKNQIDKREHMRMDYGQKNEYLNSIKALKEKYADQIKILTGFELEYLPGEEENILELKKETEKIVLGQHFIYDNNKNLRIFGEDDFTDEELLRYAEYVKKAIELGIPDIVAHPDIFMCKRKVFGKVESDVAKIICEAAERHNIPLEINLAQIFNKVLSKSPDNLTQEEINERLEKVQYPRKEFWEVACKYNIKVLYGIDAHHRGQILKSDKSMKLANKKIGEEIISKLNFIKEIN